MTIASVGNIETRLLGNPDKASLAIRRGIVGVNAPDAVPTTHAWTAASTLVMHSDGLSTHWDSNAFNDWKRETPVVIARRLLDQFGKADDDATVIVARSAN